MQEAKAGFRRLIQSKLTSQSASDRRQRSEAIQKKLFGLAAFQNARCVLFYAALPVEVDTWPMIDQAVLEGKKVALPLSDLKNKALRLYQVKGRRALRPGALGILEPDPSSVSSVDPNDLDCVIVPGLVFDRARRRLGRGAGFYDRFLTSLSPAVPKIGLAFSFQIVDQVPVEAHDQILDFVLTD